MDTDTQIHRLNTEKGREKIDIRIKRKAQRERTTQMDMYKEKWRHIHTHVPIVMVPVGAVMKGGPWFATPVGWDGLQ